MASDTTERSEETFQPLAARMLLTDLVQGARDEVVYQWGSDDREDDYPIVGAPLVDDLVARSLDEVGEEHPGRERLEGFLGAFRRAGGLQSSSSSRSNRVATRARDRGTLRNSSLATFATERA